MLHKNQLNECLTSDSYELEKKDLFLFEYFRDVKVITNSFFFKLLFLSLNTITFQRPDVCTSTHMQVTRA